MSLEVGTLTHLILDILKSFFGRKRFIFWHVVGLLDGTKRQVLVSPNI